MSVYEGGTIVVVESSVSWPLPTEEAWFEKEEEGVFIRLLAKPEGMLQLLRTSSSQETVLFESVPIVVLRGNIWFLGCSWSGEQGQVYVNDSPLPPNSPGAPPFEVTLGHREGVGASRNVYTEPSAAEQCDTWVQWRATHLRAAPPSDPNRRPLSPREEFQLLVAATHRLQILFQLLNSGDLTWIGPLTAELRALIYWKDRDFRPNSNVRYKQIPLLFRVAQYADVALPVFVYHDFQHTDANAREDLLFQFRGNEAYLQTNHSSLIIVDFQEWLTSPMFLSNSPERNLRYDFLGRVRNLVAAYAETLGTSHYDLSIPREIDELLRVRLSDNSFTLVFITSIATVTLNHALYVLEQVGPTIASP